MLQIEILGIQSSFEHQCVGFCLVLLTPDDPAPVFFTRVRSNWQWEGLL